MLCVQGEKGEPGLVIGPDGNFLNLAQLAGPKVSLSEFDYLDFYLLCINVLMVFGVFCDDHFVLETNHPPKPCMQGDRGLPGPVGPPVRFSISKTSFG